MKYAFSGMMLCTLFLMSLCRVPPVPISYINTYHEWPKIAQYPNRRFDAEIFAEKVMPLGKDSFWEISLILKNTRAAYIGDVHLQDETIEVAIGEEHSNAIMTIRVPVERWLEKKPFSVYVTSMPGNVRTLFIVTHSAKERRFLWG